MDDMTPTPEDLARDLRQDLAALLRATPKAQWEWGEDDLWDFVHHAKAAGIAGARRTLAAETEVARLRAALERIACFAEGEVGPHMKEPRAAAIAREVLE